jgi:hypothetical protein
MGDVTITIQDGQLGAINVPLNSVQVVIGCSTTGTVAQPVATRDPNVLVSTFGCGPLVEAAALIIANGGVAIAIKATSNAAGTCGAVNHTGAGTSVVTASGAAADDYYINFKVIAGGTIGVAGITFQVSLDAGRTYGPVLALGTASTYLIPNTTVTLAFAAGTMLAGQLEQLATVAPAWNTAGIQACLNALQASAFASSGWGSMHIVGVCSAANAATIDGYLTTLATGYIYTRALVSAVDASPAATPWGGSGQIDATWTTAITAAFAANSTKRIWVNGPYWNIPSMIPNPAAGNPRYRRSAAWAAAARRVAVTPQRTTGRVKDGPLNQIVIDPVNDPLDGFVYHDEQVSPTLDSARFMTTIRRVGLPGVYILKDNLMSPAGSDFTILPRGNIMDLACGISHQVGQQFIGDDVRTNPNGTIDERDAKGIEIAVKSAIDQALTANRYISSCSVLVDRTINVQGTSSIAFQVTIVARGYILTETITIGFQNPNFASA